MKTNPTIIAARERKERREGKISLRSLRSFAAIALGFVLAGAAARAQVNSGSDGHDGAFQPTVSTNINMADHPDGIYHYTSVDIPGNVVVTFTPNANNSPVVWLVQSNCSVNGSIQLLGGAGGVVGVYGNGGPGGFRGGTANYPDSPDYPPGDGLGPGGGRALRASGGNGSFATKGQSTSDPLLQGASGDVYGNSFLLPLVGGSGGGGGGQRGGGGGGGAILIAANNLIRLDGLIAAYGGAGVNSGAGSGGAVRLVATHIQGQGQINVSGGQTCYNSCGSVSLAGVGRVRFDASEIGFGGGVVGTFTSGFQPIIIQSSNQGVQLSIQSVSGNSVPANPSSTLANPAVIIPAQQANPIPIVVRCSNIPLNTPITVTVKPVNGPAVSATANNTAGTAASSTATVNLNMPRGGGIIYATTVVGLAGQQASLLNTEKTARLAAAPERGFSTRSTPDLANVSEKSEHLSTGEAAAGHRPALRELPLSVTGWTASGERFAQMEITAALGGAQQITYITESGQRYPLAAK